MIKFRIPLRSIRKTVTTPLARNVLEDLRKMFYIDTEIYKEVSKQIENFNGDIHDDQLKNPKTSPQLEKLILNVTENTKTETLVTTPRRGSNYRPIFLDEEINMKVVPVYVETEYTFSLNYYSKSKSNIETIINRLKLLVADRRNIRQHNLEYTFMIPEPILNMFLDVLVLKNNMRIEDEQEGYEEYLINHTDGRMTMFGSQDANVANISIGVKETQLGINGWFDGGVDNIETEYMESETAYRASLEYKIVFNKPLSLHVEYEPQVYNQNLPSKYIQTVSNKKDIVRRDMPLTSFGTSMLPFKTDIRELDKFMQKVNSEYFIKIPGWDNFIPPYTSRYYGRLLSVMLYITTEDKRTLMNLRDDITPYAFDPDVLAFMMSSEYEYMHRSGYSVFNVRLSENEKFLPEVDILIDSDMNVIANYDLDITKRYRLFFSICVDLTVLSDRASTALRNNSAILEKITSGLGIASKVNESNLREMIKTKSVDLIPSAIMYTVMQTAIISERK